jgi:hypothetical protein
MTHCSDDDLILAYYGESDAHDDHLAACAECTARYRTLRDVLELAAADAVPQRGEHYGLEVWQRIRPRLPEPQLRWYAVWARWPAAAAAVAALLLVTVGFTAGRISLSRMVPSAEVATPAPEAGIDDEARRRVLMLTVADHLERSERVLTDIVNATEGADISMEQQWADDLLAASRLYRLDAVAADELSIASLLDELERTLLEIVHRPSHATREDLDEIRRRVDSLALLFKVRVMSGELRDQTEPPAAPASTVTSTIG